MESLQEVGKWLLVTVWHDATEWHVAGVRADTPVWNVVLEILQVASLVHVSQTPDRKGLTTFTELEA